MIDFFLYDIPEIFHGTSPLLIVSTILILVIIACIIFFSLSNRDDRVVKYEVPLDPDESTINNEPQNTRDKEITEPDSTSNHPDLIFCITCGNKISSRATACPHCGEPIQKGEVSPLSSKPSPTNTWNPGIAALLSLLLPGAGQMYKGQVGTGIVWLVLTLLSYSLCILPGIILHICCIIGAANSQPPVR